MKSGNSKKMLRKALPKVTCQQLTQLKGVLQETSRHYVERLERELFSASQRIDQASKGKKLKDSQLNALEDLLELIQQTPLKPEKGRRKDLKRLDLLIGKVTDTVETW
jgi:uncharacterized protein YciW